MRLKEQKLWDRMRANLQGHARLERIENMASTGIPDVLVLREGRVTMPELKCVKALPKRGDTRVLGDEGLDVDQRNWHMDWTRHGGRSMIIIGVEGVGIHWALWGAHADRVNDMNQVELMRHAFATGVRHGDGFWRRVLEQL